MSGAASGVPRSVGESGATVSDGTVVSSSTLNHATSATAPVMPAAISATTAPQTPNPPVSDPSMMVGKRVSVYWPLDKAWYEGEVHRFDKEKNQYHVTYDDGDDEILRLDKEQWKICENQQKPATVAKKRKKKGATPTVSPPAKRERKGSAKIKAREADEKEKAEEKETAKAKKAKREQAKAEREKAAAAAAAAAVAEGITPPNTTGDGPGPSSTAVKGPGGKGKKEEGATKAAKKKREDGGGGTEGKPAKRKKVSVPTGAGSPVPPGLVGSQAAPPSPKSPGGSRIPAAKNVGASTKGGNPAKARLDLPEARATS